MQRPPRPRFVILGGSFNPVHLGHVALARGLAALPGVTRVFAIPAARNPLKDGGRLLPPELRLAMVRTAFAGLPNVAVLDVELVRGPPSYTFDTVTELRAAHPEAVFEIALGWDAFRDFGVWYRAEALLELAGMLIVPRIELGDHPALAGGLQGRAVIECLPESWRSRLTEAEPGVWSEREGRAVVRLVPLRIPDVSATRILAERRWDLVPEPARALLLRYVDQGEPPAGGAGSRSGRHPG